MITVKIELWPRGREEGREELGRMYIANDGNGTRERGNYRVAVCRKGSTEVPIEILHEELRSVATLPPAARAATVANYPRLSLNVWRLIARAVHAAFPEETTRAKRDERTLLDGAVMRGLAKFIHDRIAAMPPQPGKKVDEVFTPDECAAIEWISEMV